MNKQELGKERSKRRMKQTTESFRLPTASIHRANFVFPIPAPQLNKLINTVPTGLRLPSFRRSAYLH